MRSARGRRRTVSQALARFRLGPHPLRPEGVGQQGAGLGRGEHVKGRCAGGVACGQAAKVGPAGDEDRDPGGAGQQRPDLLGTGVVVGSTGCSGRPRAAGLPGYGLKALVGGAGRSGDGEETKSQQGVSHGDLGGAEGAQEQTAPAKPAQVPMRKKSP
jgi:hypothetical protein